MKFSIISGIFVAIPLSAILIERFDIENFKSIPITFIIIISFITLILLANHGENKL